MQSEGGACVRRSPAGRNPVLSADGRAAREKPFAALSAKHIIIILTAAYVLVAIAVVISAAVVSEDETWEDAVLTTTKAAAVLAERAQRTIQATRVILQTERQHIAMVGLNTVTDSPEEWQRFHNLANGLPENGDLWLHSADGSVLLVSFTRTPPPVSAAGRDYLTAFQREPRDFYVGAVIKGRWTKTYSWPMSLPIEDPGGHLQAVITASIKANYFSPLLQSANLGEDAVIEIFRSDGTLLLHQPIDDDFKEDVHVPPVWMSDDSATLGEGTLRWASPFDHVERLYAYRHLPEFDLYALVGLPVSAIDAQWKSRIGTLTAVLLAALAPMTALSLVGLKIAARETASQEALAEANRLLERRVDERTGEAQAARQAAERANDQKSRFLAAASHDLRQPIQAIRLFVDLLRQQLTESPYALALARLHEATAASEELLTDLMSVSALEAGVVNVTPEPIDVDHLMRTLADEWSVQARAKGLDLRRVPVETTILCDGLLLRRALGNLLANAVRYTTRGRILFGCRRSARGLRFEVHDTGPGIPADRMDMIFEDFYQLGNEERDRAKGLGLGLGIVKRTADLLGLEISVRSKPGRGSCFALLVPHDIGRRSEVSPA